VNETQNFLSSGFSANEAQAEFDADTLDAKKTACSTESLDCETADSGLKSFQQNTTRRERFLLSKHIEEKELQKFIGDSVDKEKDIRDLNEPCNIHKARHAAVGELLGVVAHKWRQPLNSIAMIINNMVDAWKYGEMNDELMERSELRAKEQINILTRTIDDFRSFLDPDTTTEYLDPVKGVKAVVAELSTWFSDSSTIEIRVTNESEEPFQALGCQHAFERVIVNLICNANDAIQQHQLIVGSESKGVISVCLAYTTKNIVISVEDTGGGIDESNQAHIFEPYFTTKHKDSGFGMGLYLSKLVVENSMNGKLWFENLFEGARFCVQLPAISGERMCQ